MTTALTLAFAISWGALVAWAFLRAVLRAARAPRAAGTAPGALRTLLFSLLVALPALVEPVAVAGSLGSFVLAKNALLLREVNRHAR